MYTHDPARPSAADENVERLLRHAYVPERPDADFARRVTTRMLATARSRTQAKPRPWVHHPRIAWGLAAAVFVALTFGALSAMNPPDRPRDPEPRAELKTEPKPLTKESPEAKPTPTVASPTSRTEPAHLTPRPRTNAPEPKHLAVGDSIRTKAGQRSRVVLPDGSVLFLNEKTDATLTAQRHVRLDAGEVYVEVAPRENDEFKVVTPQREVAALGTRFAVQAEKDGTGVVVTQGRVKVDGLAELVRTGEQVLPGAKEIETAPRATHVLGWMEDLVTEAGGILPANPRAGGVLVVKDSYGHDASLSLRKYHVDVHIEDGFARTTIDQTYFNHEQRRLEGTFHFPLPTDASLSRLAMYVNGELMEGGMAEREIARAIYEGIVRKMQDPALLEWVDGSTFKMRVFPLEPRQEKRIVLSYTQKLPGLYGDTSYRFPAGHSLEAVRDWSFHATVKHGAKFGWNCSSHDLKVTTQGGDLLLDGEAKEVKVDRDIVLDMHEATTTEQEKQDAIRFTSAVLDGSKYLMLRYRPKLPGVATKQRRDWVILFESSADRDPVLARTQVEIVRSLLTNAEHDDTFAIITLGATPHLLTEKALPASPTNIDAALGHLEQTHLIGALDLKQGLLAAEPFLKAAKSPHLVHVGSGLPGLGEKRTDELLKLVPTETRYVGVGVGKRWNRALMKSAADRSGGYFTQINPDEKVSWRAFDLLSTLNTPRLLDVKVTDKAGKVTFLTQQVALAQGEELAAAGCTGTEADKLPAMLVVTGTLDGKAFRRELPVKRVTAKADYIPRTWARLEIDRLLAENAEGNKARIVALSKGMYVMTPFTSLLVLENEAMYQQHNVDRGRKDHWAMYPCPRQIPVVTEPLGTTPLPVKEENAKATPEEVIGSVVVRNSPKALNWNSYGLRGDRFTRGGDNRQFGDAMDFDYGAQHQARFLYDIDRVEDLSVITGPVDPRRGVGIPGRTPVAPVTTSPVPPGQVSTTTESIPAPRLTVLPMAPVITSGIGGPGWAPMMQAPFGSSSAPGGPMAGSGGMPWGGSVPMSGPGGFPGATGYSFGGGSFGGMGGAFGGGGFGPAAGNGTLPGGGMPVLGGFRAPQPPIATYYNGRGTTTDNYMMYTNILPRLKTDGLGAPGDEKALEQLLKLSKDGTSNTVRLLDVLDAERAPQDKDRESRRWGLLNELRERAADDWTESDEVRARLMRTKDLAFSPDGRELARGYLGNVRIWNELANEVAVRGGVGDALDAWLFRLGTGTGRPVATYQRPTFHHDPRIWTDLLAQAPGLNSSAADVLATLEAEVGAVRAAPGRIDPEADVRLRRARAVWRSVTVDGVRITFDGAGWYAWERTLPLGLQEVVVCDRYTLWHLYPELGLGARRPMTAFHRAELNSLVPWVLPPAEDLARGADLKAVDKDTVAVVPTHKDATHHLHLVFGTDGRLSERRVIEAKTGKVTGKETYIKGVVKVFDGADKELASRDLSLRDAPAPALAPETKGLVLLDLPLRSRQHVLTANKANDNTVASLKTNVLINLLASDAAAGNAAQAIQDLTYLTQRSEIRPGLWTLLLASGSDPNAVAMPGAVQRTSIGRYVHWLQPAASRDWSKLLDLGDGLLRNLAMVAAFTQDWSADSAAVSGTESMRLTQFVREGRSPVLTWAVLEPVLRSNNRPVTLPGGLLGLKQKLIDEAVTSLAKSPGLLEAARYEQATLSFQAKDPSAKTQFNDLFAKASESGGLPLVEGTFRKAVGDSDAEWAGRTRRTLDRLLERKDHASAMALAWQTWDLGDHDLADEVAEAVQAKKPAGTAALPYTLAALEYYRYTSRLDRADKMLDELLNGTALKERALAWRLAGKLASERKQPVRVAECLDRALAIEHRHAGVVTVQQVRQDYSVLLGAYEQQAQAWVTLQQKPPADFAARVVAATDRWRSLDDTDATACHTAARILRSVGKSEQAWDYLSTTLTGPAAEPASVLELARGLARDGNRDLADLAYRAASDAGLAGVDAERAANLEQAGRFDDARRLREKGR